MKNKRYLLGCDIGTSSVKVSIIETDTGMVVGADFFPKVEAPIVVEYQGFAEQHPEDWWHYLKQAIKGAINKGDIDGKLIKAIGISYQMHGLVLLDKQYKVLRPAIIWCDDRGVEYGRKAFDDLGEWNKCADLLNSPGNFTASKLAWVKEHEPSIYESIAYVCLPGDYIALKLTGNCCTTVSGLSEGVFWNFHTHSIDTDLINYFGFSEKIFPPVIPSFGEQGYLMSSVAEELGLLPGITISYRAGDQPNNAFSLNVLKEGEIAASAGTSGVLYAISDEYAYDVFSRINIFAHVNHLRFNRHLGVLFCTNGVGNLYAWMRNNCANSNLTYDEMNQLAEKVPIGSDGVSILPFGNGPERMFNNKVINCSIYGLNFYLHNQAHLWRAAQEGIAFSMNYGLDIMREIGVKPRVIRAGLNNLFLSPLFCKTLSSITNTPIELYNTNGAIGAAIGAGIGSKIYKSTDEAFVFLKKISTFEPKYIKDIEDAHNIWKAYLDSALNKFR